MNGFKFMGKSTNSIIDAKLVLGTFDRVDTVIGSERSNLTGLKTSTRPIANDYGVESENLIFEYSLVKCNGKDITDEEQVIIERWLTSPKLNRELEITDSNGVSICKYCGKFLKTEWWPGTKGFWGVTFTFEHNNTYPTKSYTQKYSVQDSKNIVLSCKTDELEEFVYPILTVKKNGSTGTVSIQNLTDNSNKMTIRAYGSLPMTFDCRHCIPTDATTHGIISYADLGWKDVGNIYWLRLLPGDNEIVITGDCEVTITYDGVYKKVGGWL